MTISTLDMDFIGQKLDARTVDQNFKRLMEWAHEITTALNNGMSKYQNFSSATTMVLKNGSGVLVNVAVNKAVAGGVITIKDGNTPIATITHPGTIVTSQYTNIYNAGFSNNLTVTTSSTDDVTVTWT